MSGFQLAAKRPGGRALIIGTPSARALPAGVLSGAGQEISQFDDPFTAMAELCHRPLAYRVVALCLNSLYREELQLITSLKRRYPHLEVWLAQIDGRAGALVEATRLGADGLLAEDGLHPFAKEEVKTESRDPAPPDLPAPNEPTEPAEPPPLSDGTEPLLTADELRALLAEPGNPASSA